MKAKNSLGLIFFPAFDWAISPTHPEREERLLYTQDQIFEEGVGDIEGIHFFNPSLARPADVQRVHFAYPDVESIVTESHFIAAGGMMRALDAVMSKETDKAFAMVRPPGHHAQRVTYGDRGFCIINIEAVGLEYIRQKHPELRIAIVDTDCHHGDGTQDIYWNDPDTLFISFHQDGRTLYPGTGEINELGGPGAYGYNLNIPLPPNTGDDGFLHVIDNVVLPVLDDYKPDLIINSAGQDNHYTDPLTNMNFSAQGYALLNEKLNPDVAVLEGGYSIEGALPYVNLGIVLAMAGLDYSGVREPDYHEARWRQSLRVTRKVEEISQQVLKNWQNKEKLAEKEFRGLRKVTLPRQVYYDTAGIMETQQQEFKVCDDCPGVNTIHSVNDRGDSLIGVQIPRNTCPACHSEGYRLFEIASKAQVKRRFLQDKSSDQYFASTD